MNRVIRTIRNQIRTGGLLHAIRFLATECVYEAALPMVTRRARKQTTDEHLALFYSFPDVAGNGKALYDYLLAHEPDMRFIWMCCEQGELPPDTNRTRYIHAVTDTHHGYPIKAFREIARAKYVFFTHISPMRQMLPKPDQLVINLWHGCGYKASSESESVMKADFRFDYALVPGKIFVETKSHSFCCDPSKILPIGFPRYDMFLAQSEKGKAWCDKLRGENDKLVMWMPTFRNTIANRYPEEKIVSSFDIPLLQNLAQLKALNAFCREKRIMLCIKRHMSQLRYSCEDKTFSNIVFRANEDLDAAGVELYEVLRYPDALISDYSSVSVDYLLADRPIAFCLEDFASYRDTRGFVFDDPREYMPGHHLYTFEDMKAFLDDVAAGRDPHKDDRLKMMPLMHNPCENYCARVWALARKEKP